MNFKFIGWCNTDNHDKIWGLVTLREGLSEGAYLIFWGRRGKKLQTKIHKDASWGIWDKINSKRERGYVDIKIDEISKDYPDFEHELNKKVVWAMLKV
jgi:predicted DNA-binding WGR domain protein